MLHQLLEKLGLRFEQLTDEEKKTYQTWSEILVAPEPDLDGVKKLVRSENARAHLELENFEIPKDKQLFYQALAHLTGVLEKFISTPANQRDALRSHLKEVFHIDI
jgi:hypothetical protein